MYVGAVQVDGTTPDIADEFLVSCSLEALGLVNKFTRQALVPLDEIDDYERVVDRAVIETTAALYQKKQDSNGIRGFNGDGNPIFVAKDPMNSVYPMLRRWVLPF